MGGRSVLRLLRPAVALGVAALALSGAALGTSPALAAPGVPRRLLPKTVHIPIPAFTDISARAAASHGYRLEVSGFYEAPVRRGTARRPVSYLSITLSKGSTEAQYGISDAVAKNGAVVASLGSLGRLRLRFFPRRASSRERPLGPDCQGRERVERGGLRGMIAFHGERGYTDFEAVRLPATLTTGPEAHCTFHPRSTKPSSSNEGIRFGGQWNRGRSRSVDFTAEEHPRLGTATLLATSFQQRGDVSITRLAKTVVPARIAPFDQAAGTASVTAPAPFTGGARFHAFPGKESGTWLGSLSVDFPGRPDVHLAGHRYAGSLISGDECGPDEPGSFCSYAKLRSPIGLGPIRLPE